MKIVCYIKRTCLLIVLGSAGLLGEAAVGQRPNIVLLVSDDHGREALGCYGNPVIKTPNLDRLAAEGTLFTSAFCTSASCSPSRATILSGLQGHGNGMYGLSHAKHNFEMFDTVKTLPEYLQEAGYRTGRIGKLHVEPADRLPFDFQSDHGMYGHDDVAMSEACRGFIRWQEPFFLYWCSWNPHRDGSDRNAPPGTPNRVGNPDQPFPGDEEQTFSPDESIVPPYLNDTPEARAELAQYYQAIARLDRGVGRLMDILKEEGKYENTVIIYVSDNGAPFPGSKTTLYEPGMHLPCIVRAPGQAPGVLNDALVSWPDITPTLLDFAGVEYDPEAFDGKSWRPILEESAPVNWRDKIFASHTFHEVTMYYPMRVVRTQKYKFIWNIAHELSYPSADDLWRSATWQAVRRDHPENFGCRTVEAYLYRPRFELYDLEADPRESNNLAGHPAYAERLAKFIDEVKTFQADTEDPWLMKWDHE